VLSADFVGDGLLGLEEVLVEVLAGWDGGFKEEAGVGALVAQ
jgi:hypothetical protein